MTKFSNNVEPKSGLKDVPAVNQERNSSFGKKGGPALPLNPAEEDEHIIRKSSPLIGGKI